LVASNRDHIVVQLDDHDLAEAIEPVLHFDGDNKDFCEHFGFTAKANWNIAASRRRLRQVEAVAQFIETIEYRPFDRRAMFFHPDLVWQSSPVTSMHITSGQPSLVLACLGKNRGNTRSGQWVFRRLADKSVVSGRDNASGFPLFITPVDGEPAVTPVQLAESLMKEIAKSGAISAEERAAIQNACRELYPDTDYPKLPAFDPRLIRELQARWCCGWSFDGFVAGHDLGPEALAAMLYATWYSARYRDRFQAELVDGFPVIILPLQFTLVRTLARLGADLFALHLLEADYSHASWNQPGATTASPLATPITTFHDAPHGDREVRKVGEKGKAMAQSPMGDGLGRVYINDTAYFDGVPEAVWNFHIGGYQVCHKWLSDRKGVAGGKNPHPGRTLTDEDIAHYHRIVIALNETIRLMAEIDEVIEEHGGWPGAFVTE
jgi:predicted helicase